MATQLTIADPRPQLPQSPEAQKFSLMQRQAALFAQSPLIPQHLRTGTPEQAMANCYIAMTIADRMGEDRMTVMQNIHIVHGTAGFKAQYMIARANASGKFRDSIDWEVKGKGKDLAVTAFATLASTGRRVAFEVTMAMAEAEGWTKNSKYKTLPELMLRYRSGTFLVRLYAPEVMLGYQTVEESEDLAFAAATATAPLTGQALLEQAREDSAPAPQPGAPTAEAGSPSETEEVAASVSEGPDDSQSGDGDADAMVTEAAAWIDRYEAACKAATDLAPVHRDADETAALIKAQFPELYSDRLSMIRPADAPERGEGGQG